MWCMHVLTMTDTLSQNVARARQDLVLSLAAVARGDKAAFATLYMRTHIKLFGICLRICADQAAAEDILQEVYIQVWRKASQYDAARSSPVTWLVVIARNRAIDWLRTSKITHDDESALANVPDTNERADEYLVRLDEEARLKTCLGNLSAMDRTFILETFFRGLTYADLAVSVGTPLGTVKNRIRRALLTLRVGLSLD